MNLSKVYHFILDGIPSYSHDLIVTERPDIPAPSKDFYSPGDITGVDGSYYEDLGTFRNIEVELKCAFISENPNMWHCKWREIKNWILGTKHMIYRFSDDMECYRKIAKVTLDTSERQALSVGSFSIKFEFEPFEYLDDGLNDIDCKYVTQNDYYLAHPIYYINGHGECELNVNGRSFKVNCNGQTVVDSNLKIAYCDDKLVQTVGDFEDLWLENGPCQITSTKSCTVQPNWRCI